MEPMRLRTLALGTVLAGPLFAFAAAVSPAEARAESVIKNPGDHPDYSFEAEPHGLIGFSGPLHGKHGALGAGFRGTVVLVDNGFIETINNSVGITFGADFFFGRSALFLPVAMQWNFWLTTRWSVFGEPGLGLAAHHDHKVSLLHPVLMAGGRFHFNDKVSLTMRIGYPAFSIGASFFL